MTTSVKVTAHCGPDTQVRITRSNLELQTGDVVILHNGDSNEQLIYDKWHIEVSEEPRVSADVAEQARE